LSPHESERRQRPDALKPDGHRYEAPESKDTRINKEVAYAVLGILVMVLAVLIATGKVPIYPGG
jgi:hypothetical protein